MQLKNENQRVPSIETYDFIGRINDVISCVRDENEEAQKNFATEYTKQTVRVTLDPRQIIDMQKQWGINVVDMTINASLKELMNTHIQQYIKKIKEFAERNTAEHNCKLTSDVVYNVVKCMDMLDAEYAKDHSDLEDDITEKAIFVTPSNDFINKVRTAPLSIDLTPDDKLNSKLNPYIRHEGYFRGVPVYTLLLSSKDDNFVILCQDINNGYALHYYKDSLQCEFIKTEGKEEYACEVSFMGGFIEKGDDNYKCYFEV